VFAIGLLVASRAVIGHSYASAHVLWVVSSMVYSGCYGVVGDCQGAAKWLL